MKYFSYFISFPINRSYKCWRKLGCDQYDLSIQTDWTSWIFKTKVSLNDNYLTFQSFLTGYYFKELTLLPGFWCQWDKMSIFNILPFKNRFKGCIRTNHKNFGYFSADSNKIRLDLAPALHQISQNLWKKKIEGIIFFCKFDNHDGKHTFNSTK